MIHDLPFQPRSTIETPQEQRFAQMLDLCFERHPYYRQQFYDLGLARADFRSLSDIVKIPVIDKHVYAADPEAFRLDTTGLDKAMTIDWDVMHTTGTSSGKPTPFHSTTYDFYNTLTTNRRALELRGVRSTDIVANLCPMTMHPYGAYHRTIAAANAMKIPVVSPLPGRPSDHFHWSASTDEVVACIERSSATILWGVASYVRRVIMQAQLKEADFSAIRFAFITGEGVSEAMRDDMTQRLESLGAVNPEVNVSYAATEMQVGAVECQPGSGYHNPAPDEFYFEIVDAQTHEVLPSGERGLAVLTHLNRRGTILLRYLLGDLTVQSLEPCPHCGATTDRFVEPPTRGDGLIKIKGMLINPAVVEATLMAVPSVGEFQLRIEHENPEDTLSMDKFIIHISAENELNGISNTEQIAELVRSAIGIRPHIKVVNREVIFDSEVSVKALRLIDLRSFS
jgi:phenylacetate-CoA ligase